MRSSVIPASIFALAACIPGWTAHEIKQRMIASESSTLDIDGLFADRAVESPEDLFGRKRTTEVREVSLGEDSGLMVAYSAPGVAAVTLKGGTLLYNDSRVVNSGVFDAPATAYAGTRVTYMPAAVPLSVGGAFAVTSVAQGLLDSMMASGQSMAGVGVRSDERRPSFSALGGPARTASVGRSSGGSGVSTDDDGADSDQAASDDGGVGAILAAVPVPASIPLLLTAFGGLALMRRPRTRG